MLEPDPCTDAGPTDDRAGLQFGERTVAPLPSARGLLPFISGTIAVSSNGIGALVAWQIGGNLVAARVAADGSVVDSTPLVLGAIEINQPHTVTFDGESYVAAWVRTGIGVVATRVGADGVVIQPGGAVLIAEPLAQHVALGATAVAWSTSDGSLFIAHLTRGVVSAVSLVEQRPGTPIWSLNLAIGDTTTAIETIEGIAGSQNASVVFVANDTLARQGVGAHFAGPLEIDAAIAFGAGTFLAAVVATIGGDEQIIGLRVTPAGVQGAPIDITTSVGSNRRVGPSVAFDGTQFQVAWQARVPFTANGQIFSTTVTPSGEVGTINGAVIDPVTSSPMRQENSVALTAIGTQVFAAYAESRGQSAVKGLTLGQPPGKPLSTTRVFRSSPRAVLTSDGYVVLWVEHRVESSIVSGVRVDAAGQVTSAVNDTAPASTFEAIAHQGRVIVALPPPNQPALQQLEGSTWAPFAMGPEPWVVLPVATQFSLASNGDTLLAGMTGAPAGTGVSLNTGSTLLNPTGQAIGAFSLFAREVGFGAVFVDSRGVSFASLKATGAVTGPSVTLDGPYQGPVVAFRDQAVVRTFDGNAHVLRPDGGDTVFSLGGELRSRRFAVTSFGGSTLLGWASRLDGGIELRGARRANDGVLFTFDWPLPTANGELALAPGLIAFEVADRTEANIAWRTFSDSSRDAGAASRRCSPPAAQVPLGCAQTLGPLEAFACLALLLMLTRAASGKR